MEFDSSCCFLLLLEFDSSPFRVYPHPRDAGARGEAQPARLLQSGVSKKYLLARLHRSQVEWEDRVLVPSHFYANIFPVGPGCIARRSMTPVFRSLTSCASEHRLGFVRCVWAPVWFCLEVRWLHNADKRQGKSHRVEMARG